LKTSGSTGLLHVPEVQTNTRTTVRASGPALIQLQTNRSSSMLESCAPSSPQASGILCPIRAPKLLTQKTTFVGAEEGCHATFATVGETILPAAGRVDDWVCQQVLVSDTILDALKIAEELLAVADVVAEMGKGGHGETTLIVDPAVVGVELLVVPTNEWFE